MAQTNTVPFWWIVLFLLLALGAGAFAVQAVGGSLVAGSSGTILLPLH